MFPITPNRAFRLRNGQAAVSTSNESTGVDGTPIIRMFSEMGGFSVRVSNGRRRFHPTEDNPYDIIGELTMRSPLDTVVEPVRDDSAAASTLIDAYTMSTGAPCPWDKAVRIVSLCTGMSPEQTDMLLALD